MKLNNHGWSLNQMLLCCSILLIALFFVVFFSMQLMNQFKYTFKEMITGKVTYRTIERNIKNGALQYMDKYYKDDIGIGTITVLTDNLIYYTILKEEDLVTTEKDTCRGYALVRKNSDNTLHVDSYILCSDYTTKGFQEWRMGEVNE